MNDKLAGWFGLSAAALLSAACFAPQGPHVRVATATPAEIEAVRDQDNVWYEFQPGDVVPVQFAFLGVAEGGSDRPSLLRAKRPFYFVMQKSGPMQISFDGKTFATPESLKAVVAVMPGEPKGGKVGWIIYMGESGDVKSEIDAVVKRGQDKKQAKPQE
ncbi:MAG: hypothetical protein HY898_26540 [Deltaproteobacteria bacterium]|nr:hypothetical protein [Deltaproteobacteria bacterium]